jgi:hypothetical protein
MKRNIHAPNIGEHTAPKAASVKSSLSPTVSERLIELMNVNGSLLPVWVRCPVCGPEHFSGLTRSKLYQLAGESKIRSISLREPSQTKGTRLFNLASILEYIESCETGNPQNN